MFDILDSLGFILIGLVVGSIAVLLAHKFRFWFARAWRPFGRGKCVCGRKR